ncbi:hypothetical protein ACJX0J_007022, partial [Zea mays]
MTNIIYFHTIILLIEIENNINPIHVHIDPFICHDRNRVEESSICVYTSYPQTSLLFTITIHTNKSSGVSSRDITQHDISSGGFLRKQNARTRLVAKKNCYKRTITKTS